jgi:hypothetical protein
MFRNKGLIIFVLLKDIEGMKRGLPAQYKKF